MQKIKKIICIFSITFLIVNIFNVALGYNPNSLGETQIIYESEKVAEILPSHYKPAKLKEADAEVALSKVGLVLGATRNISVVVSVIGLTVIGIKYMLGSVEEKANYKATMFPYIIGFVLAISGTTLVSFIYNAVH